MAQINIKMRGLDELRRGLLERAAMKDVKDVVQENTQKLDTGIQNHARIGVSFNKGYSKGFTRQSANFNIANAGLTGIAGVGMKYDPYVEFGTYKMAAEPFVKPAFLIQKIQFVNDLKHLIN